MVLKLSSLGGGSSANGFNIDIGSSGNTTVSLGQTYPAGGYSITSQLSDSSMDVYAIAEDESLAGYTATKALNTSKDFNKIVIFGATSNDLLTFEFKSTVQPTSSGSDLYASPYITSISNTVLSIDQTVTVSGGNFGTLIQAYFVGSDNVERPAKNIVRSSNSELIITRPDEMYSSFNKIKLVNPGVDIPSANNVHESANSITPAAYALSGGTITELNGYRYHVFTATSSIEFSDPGYFEALVVGAGGGGGVSLTGGGGGGGVAKIDSMYADIGPLSISIGGGGAGGTGAQDTDTGGSIGSSTSIGSVSIIGGGGAPNRFATSYTSTNDYLGGANGGGGSNDGPGPANGNSITLPVGVSGSTYSGFSGGSGVSGSNYPGGGGGGANSNGQSVTSNTSAGGAGGSGKQIDFGINNFYWAGGGGGSSYTGSNGGGNGGIGGGGGGSANTGAGGTGGGSAFNSGVSGGSGGGNTSSNTPGGSGGANTGGGGGAGAHSAGQGGAGGSGIVIIRYPI